MNKLLGMSLILFTASKLSLKLNSLCGSELSKPDKKYLAIGWHAVPVVSITGLKGSRFSKVL